MGTGTLVFNILTVYRIRIDLLWIWIRIQASSVNLIGTSLGDFLW
jgi:hypothetical protein